MKPKIVIFGCGSQGLIVADILQMLDAYELVGFLDDKESNQKKGECHGLPVMGGRNALESTLNNNIRHIVVAIGDNDARMEITETCLAVGFTLATVIHPHASIAAGVSIGPGTIIKAQAVVEPGAIIQESVVIGAQAYIGHDCVIENGVHVSAGGIIGGGTQIGEGSWVGIGATVINQRQVGKRVKIGAGSAVIEDIPDDRVAFGVPARILWDRDLWQDDP